MKPGDLVQIKRGVVGQGEVGIIVTVDTVQHYGGGLSVGLHTVLFGEGDLRDVHPTNLQKPDGRTRRWG